MLGAGTLLRQAVLLPAVPCRAVPSRAEPGCARGATLRSRALTTSVAADLVALVFTSARVPASAARPNYSRVGDRRPPNRFEGMRKHLGHFYPERVCYL